MKNSNPQRIYLSSPTIHGEEQKYVAQAFDTNWVAPLGPNVDGFEQEMAAYISRDGGCEPMYAAALSSGTAAIHLALKLLDTNSQDVVFVSSLTFSASTNPICYEHAKPVLIDSEPNTWNMSPSALREAFLKYGKPKAVICVHLYGTPAKLDEILALCEEYQVPLIEDSAESLGSTYRGKMTGTFGAYGILSFNGNKIITTSGGGMLLAKDEKSIARARFLSTQARDKARHYQHSVIGYNYRMSNVVAGIGRGQLIHLEEHKKKKQEIYHMYQEAFASLPAVSMNPMNPEGDANNWLSCITIQKDCDVTPDMVMDALEADNIECRPIWKPMNLQPVFAECDFFSHNKEEISVGEDIFQRGLCLPSDIKNTEEDMQRIISIVKDVFHG